MVGATAVGKDAEELLHPFGCFPAQVGIEDDETDGAATGGGHSGGGALAVGEKGGEIAVNLTRIGSAFALLVFETVELGEDVGGEADVVVGKAVDAAGVVQKDVGIENEIFSVSGRGDKSEFLRLRFGQARRFAVGGAFLRGSGFIKELDLGSFGSLHKVVLKKDKRGKGVVKGVKGRFLARRMPAWKIVFAFMENV